MEEFDFRFGKIAQLYYEIANQKVPCQMDLLDEWFPGLMIITDSSDGNTKTPAERGPLDRPRQVCLHYLLFSLEKQIKKEPLLW